MIRKTSWCFAGVFLLASLAFGQPQLNQFIDDTVVQQIALTVAPADWAAFLANYEDNTYYHATFVWNGITEAIGIRQHGGASRSPIKPNIDLNFAHYTSGQTFLGDGFLILKANNEDPSMLHEWLAMKLFRKMGFPAPRESFATVTVNGALLGFYMIVEHDDTAFVQRNYGESGGYYYEWENAGDGYDFGNLGTNPTVYSQYLDLKTNQATSDLQTFTNLVQVINQPSSGSFTDAQFIAALEQYMDPQMFLTYAATENVLAEADGLVGGIIAMNNFNLYQFQGTTIYTLTPWDKDLTFSVPNRDIFLGFTNGPNINVLAARLVGISGYQNIYLDQLNRAATLLGGTGGWADSEITREYALINTAASNDPYKQCFANGVLYGCGTTDFQNGVAWDHTFLQTRSSFVLSEIASYGYQVPTTDPVVASVSSSGLTSTQGMSPGALVLVNGSQFGVIPGAASQYPLPHSLANNFVAVEGVRAALAFTTSGQIEMQVPWDIPIGSAAVVVSANGAMSNSFNSSMSAATPSIFAITHANGTAVSAGSPATAGEEIVIYMTGLGAVDTEPILGAAAPVLPLANATSPQVSLGGTSLTVIFAGLTPGTAGIYQVNAVLPQPLGQSGSAGLSFSTGGQSTSIQISLQ
jgi:uncharacterized protein (TIGR03437 family)